MACNTLYPLIRDFTDVYETIASRHVIYESARFQYLSNCTIKNLSEFGFGYNSHDHIYRTIQALSTYACNLYRAIIANINFCSCFFTDVLDDLTAGANDFTNLVLVNLK